MTADYEEVRDFIVLHYSATNRDDSPFWQACQHLPLPDSLQGRIELFKSQGAMREGVDELFRASSWQSVFEGMGIRPRSYSPPRRQHRLRPHRNDARARPRPPSPAWSSICRLTSSSSAARSADRRCHSEN